MKRTLRTVACFLGLAALFHSCDQIYFTTPQPVDEENIETFPVAIQGVYVDQNDSIIFGHDYFRSVDYTDKKIPKTEIDTSGNYILKGQKIYIVDKGEEIKVKGGFPFTIKDDTLYFSELTVMEIALGKKAFLRKMADNYVLNIKEEHDWYTLVFMEIGRNGDLIARILNEIDLEKLPGITHIYEDNGDQYLSARWTSTELNDLLEKGVFSDTLFNLEGRNKIPLQNRKGQ